MSAEMTPGALCVENKNLREAVSELTEDRDEWKQKYDEVVLDRDKWRTNSNDFKNRMLKFEGANGALQVVVENLAEKLKG